MVPKSLAKYAEESGKLTALLLTQVSVKKQMIKLLGSFATTISLDHI